MTTWEDLKWGKEGLPEELNKIKEGFVYYLDSTLEKNKEYILSFETNSNKFSLGIWLGEEHFLGITKDREVVFSLSEESTKELVNTDKIILKPLTDNLSIKNIKLSELDSRYSTEWSPSPKDFGHLNGVEIPLKQSPTKDVWYKIALEGEFKKEDFIGLWLGKDNFIGFLDNDLEIKVRFDKDITGNLIIKTFSETGKISKATFKKVKQLEEE